MSTYGTGKQGRTRVCQKCAYRGAELYERLVNHAEHEAEGCSEVYSKPYERMEMLARRVDVLDEENVSQNALYEVSIWTLLQKGPGEFCERCCPHLLGSAAMRGHDSARFVIAKACLDGVEWATEELRRVSRDGKPFELARAWLSELSDDGYVDARMEMASDLWERGRCDESNKVFSTITGVYPDALVRLGIHQLPDNPETALANLDKGEACEGGRGILQELERLLSMT